MTINSVVHNFGEQLQYSFDLSLEPSWAEFYRRLFPDVLSITRIDANSQWQTWGVDRLLYLKSGKTISIDEKKRREPWSDILIEEWSVARGTKDNWIPEKVGWSLDANKHCDFVAYAIVPLKKCYLLPFPFLRAATLTHIEEWKRRPKAYPKMAPNPGYWTVNVAVEWPEIKAALVEQMVRKFGVNEIDLPPGQLCEHMKQLTFWNGNI